MEHKNWIENIVPEPFHIVDRHCAPSWHVASGAHNFHNIMVIRAGEGLCVSDGQTYPIREGFFIYHAPGHSFAYETSSTNPLHLYGINFYLTSLHCDMGHWGTYSPTCLPFPSPCVLQDAERFYRLFEDLALLWSDGHTGHLLKVRSLFMDILHSLHRYFATHSIPSKNTLVMDKILTYINKNYTRKLTVAHLASLSQFNPNYFSEIFKSFTGVTPIEYVNDIRIAVACKLLAQGYGVNEVSGQVGFKDPFYFSKVFKKKKGMSPREYAKWNLQYF